MTVATYSDDPVRQPRLTLAELPGREPAWVLDRSRARAQGVDPDRLDPELVYVWVVDYSGLPMGHRRVLDVVKALKWRPFNDGPLAERVGCDPGHLRRMVADLVEWGFLDVHRPPSGSRDGTTYEVTVPVDEPPDRVSKPGRARDMSARKLREERAQDARASEPSARKLRGVRAQVARASGEVVRKEQERKESAPRPLVVAVDNGPRRRGRRTPLRSEVVRW
jgi:hypothetical protein